MSPKLRRLSGREVARILAVFGFEMVSQRGSHAKLRRRDAHGHKQTLTVPMHDRLDLGTLAAVFRQASRYVPAEELRNHFYSD